MYHGKMDSRLITLTWVPFAEGIHARFINGVNMHPVVYKNRSTEQAVSEWLAWIVVATELGI